MDLLLEGIGADACGSSERVVFVENVADFSDGILLEKVAGEVEAFVKMGIEKGSICRITADLSQVEWVVDVRDRGLIGKLEVGAPIALVVLINDCEAVC